MIYLSRLHPHLSLGPALSILFPFLKGSHFQHPEVVMEAMLRYPFLGYSLKTAIKAENLRHKKKGLAPTCTGWNLIKILNLFMIS